MYGVNIVGVGLCRYWTPCCANRDVGCGYIESFDRKGLKLVGTLSGQSTVRPPPILGSCANESVEVQKSSARDVNNIRFSSQPPKWELVDHDEAGGGTGTHSPKMPLRTRSVRWFYNGLATHLA